VSRKAKRVQARIVNQAIVGLAVAILFVAFCSSAEAQQPRKIPRIGYLGAVSPSANAVRIEAFRQGLRELGYVEGKNIVIEWRFAEGKLDRLPALAAELVRLKVDIVITGGSGATRPAHEATNTIPIVMAGAAPDPVKEGFVEASPIPAATSPVLLSVLAN